MFFVIIIINALCVLLLLLRRRQNKKAEYNPEPPTYPGALPLIGHAHMLYGDTLHVMKILQLFSYYTLKVGGVAKFYIGSDTYYAIADPDDVLTILNTCLDKAPIYKIAKEWLGNGLATAEVSMWKNHRKLLAPAFSQHSVSMQFLSIFNSQSRKLIRLLDAEVGKGKFNPSTYIIKNAVETVNQTIFGLNIEGSMVNIDYLNAFSNLVDILIERATKVWLCIPFLNSRSEQEKLNKAINNCKAIIREAIQKYHLESGSRQNIGSKCKIKTVLSYLIPENMTNSNIMTTDTVRDHLEAFIIGSFETTTTTLVYALNLIGSHTKVQEQIYKEIEEVLGAVDRNVEKEHLSKLVYLEAVVKETLRLYPAIPIIARTSQNDVKLKNYTIPRGHTFACSIHGVHHHPAWGEDVEEFKPERWLGPNRPSAKLFIPFSSGRRNCIGDKYALIVMKTVLVHIIRRFIISSDNNKLMHKFAIIMKPVSGYEISLKSRI